MKTWTVAMEVGYPLRSVTTYQHNSIAVKIDVTAVGLRYFLSHFFEWFGRANVAVARKVVP